jgi:endo-1,4-beta-D-glucanase Y
MKFFITLSALIGVLACSLFSAPKFPFPHNAEYPYGIMPSGIDNEKVQETYEEFMDFYEESGDLARIMHDNLDTTVSEGIAYGMIVMVYMDNDKNNTRDKFDKLWNYYNNFLNENGLMNWKINGFSNVANDGRNSASDAELDAAFALLQAYKQWDDEKYLTDATELIRKIAEFEINENGFIKPGDSWDSEKNPSYFSTAALELFKQASNFGWDRIIENSYNLIAMSRNPNTGLVPNWCNEQGSASSSAFDPNRGAYYYDATRTPWRLAWAYSWYGHEKAKETCDKIASWISSETGNDPSKVVDGYNLDGSEIGRSNNATFVGPFACAGMVDESHRSWLDESYSHLASIEETVYYQVSLKMLTLLYLSGNMPNLWDPPNSISPLHRSGLKNSEHLDFAFSNTANGVKQISFSVSRPDHVNISIYTVSGKLVYTLLKGNYEKGIHHVTVNPSVPAGAYILRMTTQSAEVTKPLMMTR